MANEHPEGRRPKPPRLTRQAWNLARSLADFVADGCRTVTKEQYQTRLEICDGCDRRRGNRCMSCGCRLSLKARGRAFKCPEGKWPGIDAHQGASTKEAHEKQPSEVPTEGPPTNRPPNP